MKLLIASKREGFRRAGRAWPATATEVDASEFSADQLAALKAEPMLTVEEAKDAPAAENNAEQTDGQSGIRGASKKKFFS